MILIPWLNKGTNRFKIVSLMLLFHFSRPSQQVSGYAANARFGHRRSRGRSACELLHLHCTAAAAASRSERQPNTAAGEREILEGMRLTTNLPILSGVLSSFITNIKKFQ